MAQDALHRLSLLSLSIAAADAVPIAPSLPASDPPPRPSQGPATASTKHRRLSSAGRSRRRLSDARDAATRPFPASLQTASASLAALSLSSPTVSHRHVNSTQPIHLSSHSAASELEPGSIDGLSLSVSPPLSHIPVNATKSARKRGSIFTCESCSKVYRHPSCLIKHRWEHTPQWREASKFVFSKHQQVQLLEAAAILSHLSPSSASLPEDRSLWPSFLSGGLVPPPVPVPNNTDPTPTAATSPLSFPSMSSSDHSSHPIPSSVPANTTIMDRAPSTGPRLHDYAIDESGIGITQVRPGVLGMPTPTRTHRKCESVPVSMPTQTTEDDALNLLALHTGRRESRETFGSWGGPTSVPHSHSRAHSHSLSFSSPSFSLHPPSSQRERQRRRSNAYEYNFHAARPGAGWSLPRSSVRSKSGSSGSASASESRSDDEREDEDEAEGDVDDVQVGLEDDEMEDRVDRTDVFGPRVRAWKTEHSDGEQTWDGMEMEMEMD